MWILRLRPLLLVVALMGAALALAACPSPKMPKGPPPEYEDPPAPSWFEAGAPTPLDAGPPGPG